jgi:hypothetical protein
MTAKKISCVDKTKDSVEKKDFKLENIYSEAKLDTEFSISCCAAVKLGFNCHCDLIFVKLRRLFHGPAELHADDVIQSECTTRGGEAIAYS